MAYEQKPNTGSLFVNERKEKETHPDWQGTINVDGKDYWLSGWTKSGAKGEFYSLSVKPKEAASNAEQRRAVSQKAQAPDAFADDLNDELPY